jgi:hypothetical protein
MVFGFMRASLTDEGSCPARKNDLESHPSAKKWASVSISQSNHAGRTAAFAN